MLLKSNKRLRQVMGVLETGNLLFLKLLWKRPRGAAQYPGVVFRSYMSLVQQDRWRCVPIFELLGTREGVQITLEHLPSEVISTPLEQLACLALITKCLEPRVVFEIGTFRGRTALNFALNAPSDATIYTLDLPPSPDIRIEGGRALSPADARILSASETGCDYRGKPAEHKIKQLFGNSQTFDFSAYRGACDLIYVDGAHHYDAVLRDTENAIDMVRPGGLVLWDEFANYGDYNDVTRAVIDRLGEDAIVQVENTQLAVWRKPVAN